MLCMNPTYTVSPSRTSNTRINHIELLEAQACMWMASLVDQMRSNLPCFVAELHGISALTFITKPHCYPNSVKIALRCMMYECISARSIGTSLILSGSQVITQRGMNPYLSLFIVSYERDGQRRVKPVDCQEIQKLDMQDSVIKTSCSDRQLCMYGEAE